MLLVQLTLGLWALSPLNAAPPATRPTVRPAARTVPTTRSTARRPAPTAARPAPRRKSDDDDDNGGIQENNTVTVLARLPYQPDTSVTAKTLANGMQTWCKGQSAWSVVELRLAIAAGSAHDPKGLAGRSRLLATLLEKKLNQPKNPARSLAPPGGHRYHVSLGKDWVEVRLRASSSQIPAILKHLATSLQTFHKQPLTGEIRDALKKTARNYPPPSLTERVDAYLFDKQPRGQLLRGKRHTFSSIQSLAVLRTYEELYSANRMRLLLVGHVACDALSQTLEDTLGNLSRGKDAPLFPKATANAAGGSRSLLASQDLFALFQLPPLHRRSYIPLHVLRRVADKELRFQLEKAYGAPVRVLDMVQPSAHHGYFLFAVPAQPLNRQVLQAKLKKILGRLQMKRYLPALEQRVKLYLDEVLTKLQQQQESSAGAANLLWTQLLLPPHNNTHRPPPQLKPVLESLSPSTLRELALLFMSRDMSVSRPIRPFSMQRIALFIGTIILVWLLLDIVLRRTRRPDE